MEIQDLLEKIHVGHETVLDITGDPGSRKLTVEMRKLLPEKARPPERAETPPRKHTFFAARSLADYLAKYGTERTVVFADPSAGMISAVLDETSKNGVEIVEMRPESHPLWRPWEQLAGRSMPITEFAAFLARHRRSVVKPDGRELSYTLSQVRADVEIEIQRGRGKSAVNGLMVKTKIQGVDKSELVELPDVLTIRVPLYVDTEARELELDLCVEADSDGEVTVEVSAGTLLEAKVEAFEQMFEQIKKHEGVKATLTFGKPAHGTWGYLRELADREQNPTR